MRSPQGLPEVDSAWPDPGHGSSGWAPLSPSRRRSLGGSSSCPESPCGQRQARFPAKWPRTLQACLPLHPPSPHPSSALLALGSTARHTGSSPPGAAGSGAWGGAGGGPGRAWGQRGRAEGSLSATSNQSPGRRAPGVRLCEGAQLHTPIPPTVWSVSTCVSCKHVGLQSRLDSLTSAPASHVLCCPVPGRASPHGRPRETSGVTADLPSPCPSVHTAETTCTPSQSPGACSDVSASSSAAVRTWLPLQEAQQWPVCSRGSNTASHGASEPRVCSSSGRPLSSWDAAAAPRVLPCCSGPDPTRPNLQGVP